MDGFNNLALLRSETNSQTWWGFSDTEVLKLAECHLAWKRMYDITKDTISFIMRFFFPRIRIFFFVEKRLQIVKQLNAHLHD